MVPQTRRRLGRRSFCVAGPAACNSLPSDIRTASTRANFKPRFMTYLFIRSYCETAPPKVRAVDFERCPCSDFRLINCRIIIIITSITGMSLLPTWCIYLLTTVVGCVDGPAQRSTCAVSASVSSPSRTISRSTFVLTLTKDRSSVRRAPRLFVVKTTYAITSMCGRDPRHKIPFTFDRTRLYQLLRGLK